MARCTRWLAAVALVVLAIGCATEAGSGDDGGAGGSGSGGSGSGGSGSGGDLDLAELPAAVATAVCSKAFECCSAAELTDAFAGTTPPIVTEPDCESFYSTLMAAFLTGPAERGIASGRIVYHADVAGRCGALMAAATCAVAARGDDPCPSPFEGLVAAGAPCGSDLECANESDCVGVELDGSGVPTTEGACTAPPAIGQPCPDFSCAPGAYCDFGGGDPVCAAAQTDGSECYGDDECESGHCDAPPTGDPGSCGAPTSDCPL